MAISMGAAMLGSAVIGAGANLLGGNSQKKSATAAANIAKDDNEANRAFLTNLHNQNAGYLAPWMLPGQTANRAYMELLGYPQAQPVPSAFAAPQMSAYGGGYGATQAGPSLIAPSAFGGGGSRGMEHGFYDIDRMPDPAGFAGGYQTIPPPATVATGAVTAPAPSARSAFDTYRGSTGYDFRFNEGMRGLQSAFSRNLESGAASKAAIRYGQGIASDEFARYMALLGDQSRLGLSGASALAGVSQNFGNNVVAGNQSAANAAANARLYAGNVNANMWNGMGSSFGNILGQFTR